jgi:hypothetical protein
MVAGMALTDSIAQAAACETGGAMSTESNRIYYRNRERQSREMAEKAGDSSTRRIHAELAQRYAELVDAMPPPAAE